MPAATAKNYSASDIQQGPGDAWIIPGGIADSSAPQVTLFTDGSPDSTVYTGGTAAIHMGTFGGASTVVVKPKFSEITVDQADAPVARYVTAIEMSVDLDLMQLDPLLLQNCAPYATYSTVASPGYKQLTFGGVGVVAPLCLAFISALRGHPGKFAVAVLFNAHGTAGFSFAIGRAKDTQIKSKFDGLADLTRAAGRQIGAFYTTL